MGDYNKDSEQDKDKSIDFLLREMCDCSREDLLDEFEAASNTDIPLPIPEPAADEFEKIWSRIQEERAESADTTELAESEEPEEDKVVRVRFGWKRLAAIGLIACLIAGSGSIVSMGRKSYFFRERKDEIASDGVVFNNDMNMVALNGEEEAYSLIENELDIKPLRLGYMPIDMKFYEVQTGEGYVTVIFRYGDDFVYLVESKYGKEVSYNYKSDTIAEEEHDVYNKWLRKSLKIKKETLTNKKEAFETSVITDGACYRLLGIVEEEAFQKMVEELSF
ncbi:hypothetical protein LK537_23600 [Lachnoclostridium pacaense]|uniref:DUF4367 domain-containing protein n=1 Tax=Enterocloster hominis (ex Hitch et al. 2024) TaxID=1917870 RepID=A0ABV1DFS4_9FIRM|nr:hypothetical protein [Lachnoclostridium pacaense]MCC2820290.1 hypothetical protein [Lachnoclostridium pacaense]